MRKNTDRQYDLTRGSGFFFFFMTPEYQNQFLEKWYLCGKKRKKSISKTRNCRKRNLVYQIGILGIHSFRVFGAMHNNFPEVKFIFKFSLAKRP